jgi:hypothetical protein
VRSPEIPENFKRTQSLFLRVEKPLGGFSTLGNNLLSFLTAMRYNLSRW